MALRLEKGTGIRRQCGEARPWGWGRGLSPASAFPDVDECLEQVHECHYNQICENTPGGYRCGCPRGYRIQGPGLPCLGMEHRPSGALVSTPSSWAGSIYDQGSVEFCEQQNSSAH